MPPRLLPVSGSQSFNLLSLLQGLPAAPSFAKNGICASCSYTFSAKGPMTQRKQSKSRLKPHRNPYREAQAKQRKAANQARQKVLREQRAKAMGDPIRSRSTPFIESLATGRMPGEETKEDPTNFFLGSDELSHALSYSKNLSAPYFSKESRNAERSEPTTTQTPSVSPLLAPNDEAAAPPGSSSTSDPPILPIERGDTTLPPAKPTTLPNPYIASSHPNATSPNIAISLHEADHTNASRALSLISSLTNGSSADLTRFNVQRCISAFGRHSTDTVLPPRPTSIYNTNPSTAKLRAGPDTGSSEVQIAILTAKINVLADNLSHKDKLNKRNLRLMVHRRQKLLAYLRRKERAGPRWRNLVEELGIQDAMWKGEITL